MSFSSQKGEFDRFFNRLDRPVEESRPDRQPDRPVDPTGAGRPNWFPSLECTRNHFTATVLFAQNYIIPLSEKVFLTNPASKN